MQEAFQLLLEALKCSGIRYMVGGSIASSAHGVFRATNDIDIVADITEEHISTFALHLTGAFYADPETTLQALRHEHSFTVIHFDSGSKFDIFPAAGNRFVETEIERSKLRDIPLNNGLIIQCPVATAEDVLLAKLMWYRAGG